MSRSVILSDISKLVPVCNLTYENQAELLRSVKADVIESGKVLFRTGTTDKKSFYVLEGTVEVRPSSGAAYTVSAGTPDGLQPLAHQQPRTATVTAQTKAWCIAIDNDLMDVLVSWDDTAGYIVTEIDDSDTGNDDCTDWMTEILRSEIFLRIPPANIQKMFMRLEQFPVQPGELVVIQGEKGDYYYILLKGQCEVLRESPDGKKGIRLATLSSGAHFGEEALISNSERNATVRMLTEGSLMRLSRDDFNELLKEPVLETLQYQEAVEQIKQGALWLDVRVENEYQASNIKGSVNVPLYLLRLRVNTFSTDSKYIIVCDTGSHSATAAYLLSQRGFEVAVLEGGLSSVSQEEYAA